MNKNKLNDLTFSSKLTGWYKKEKRMLAFRKTKDPYKIWVSEIILQQTQMITGLVYYKNFIKKFPTIHDSKGLEESKNAVIFKTNSLPQFRAFKKVFASRRIIPNIFLKKQLL